jgi:hypothetical protein
MLALDSPRDLPLALNTTLAAAPEQLPCPNPRLRGVCDANLWAATPGVTTLSNPVVKATPLVSAYLPVASRGMHLKHLCRVGGMEPSLAATTAGTQGFLCPGRADVDASYNATLANAAACGANRTWGANATVGVFPWHRLSHAARGTNFLDAVQVPRAALPVGLVALVFTATVADCDESPQEPGRRLLSWVSGTSGALAPRRLQATPSPSPAPEAQPLQPLSVANILTTTVWVVDTNPEDTSVLTDSGRSLLWMIVGVVSAAAVLACACWLWRWWCCCPLCLRRRNSDTRDEKEKSGRKTVDTTAATATATATTRPMPVESSRIGDMVPATASKAAFGRLQTRAEPAFE